MINNHYTFVTFNSSHRLFSSWSTRHMTTWLQWVDCVTVWQSTHHTSFFRHGHVMSWPCDELTGSQWNSAAVPWPSADVEQFVDVQRLKQAILACCLCAVGHYFQVLTITQWLAYSGHSKKSLQPHIAWSASPNWLWTKRPVFLSNLAAVTNASQCTASVCGSYSHYCCMSMMANQH